LGFDEQSNIGVLHLPEKHCIALTRIVIYEYPALLQTIWFDKDLEMDRKTDNNRIRSRCLKQIFCV